MSSIVSRWPVLVTSSIAGDDLDAGGHLVQATVRRLGDAVVVALVDASPLLAAAEHTFAPTSAQLNGSFSGPGPVTVSAGPSEIYPSSFTVNLRIRPADGSGATVDAVWMVDVPGGVARALRDELIALNHAAEHAH